VANNWCNIVKTKLSYIIKITVQNAYDSKQTPCLWGRLLHQILCCVVQHHYNVFSCLYVDGFFDILFLFAYSFQITAIQYQDIWETAEKYCLQAQLANWDHLETYYRRLNLGQNVQRLSLSLQTVHLWSRLGLGPKCIGVLSRVLDHFIMSRCFGHATATHSFCSPTLTSIQYALCFWAAISTWISRNELRTHVASCSHLTQLVYSHRVLG